MKIYKLLLVYCFLMFNVQAINIDKVITRIKYDIRALKSKYSLKKDIHNLYSFEDIGDINSKIRSYEKLDFNAFFERLSEIGIRSGDRSNSLEKTIELINRGEIAVKSKEELYELLHLKATNIDISNKISILQYHKAVDENINSILFHILSSEVTNRHRFKLSYYLWSFLGKNKYYYTNLNRYDLGEYAMVWTLFRMHSDEIMAIITELNPMHSDLLDYIKIVIKERNLQFQIFNHLIASSEAFTKVSNIMQSIKYQLDGYNYRTLQIDSEILNLINKTKNYIENSLNDEIMEEANGLISDEIMKIYYLDTYNSFSNINKNIVISYIEFLIKHLDYFSKEHNLELLDHPVFKKCISEDEDFIVFVRETIGEKNGKYVRSIKYNDDYLSEDW